MLATVTFLNKWLTPYNLCEQTRAIAMVSNRCLDLALAQNRWFQTHCKLFAWPLTVTFSTISRKSYSDRYHHICKNDLLLKTSNEKQTCAVSPIFLIVKVHIFWEGHKICEISTLLLSNSRYRRKMEISQKFLAFSEYMNFNSGLFITIVESLLTS